MSHNEWPRLEIININERYLSLPVRQTQKPEQFNHPTEGHPVCTPLD